MPNEVARCRTSASGRPSPTSLRPRRLRSQPKRGLGERGEDRRPAQRAQKGCARRRAPGQVIAGTGMFSFIVISPPRHYNAERGRCKQGFRFAFALLSPDAEASGLFCKAHSELKSSPHGLRPLSPTVYLRAEQPPNLPTNSIYIIIPDVQDATSIYQEQYVQRNDALTFHLRPPRETP